MGAPDVLGTLHAKGLTLLAEGDKLLVSPSARITDEIRATIRANKAALLEALSQSETDRGVQGAIVVSSASVVRLRLTLQHDDGTRAEAILAIPKARYDGMRILEVFERHRMAGTTRVIGMSEIGETLESGH